MLVRRGVAGCILACLVLLLLALAALGSDDLSVLRVIDPYTLLCLSALVLLAGEAVHLIRKSRTQNPTTHSDNSQLSLDDEPDADTAKAPAASVDDLVQMLDDALKLARPVPAVERLEPVNLSELLGGLARRRGTTRLELRIRPRPFLTLASQPALDRALEILIENALSNGVRACVECDCGTSTVLVHVDDDGPGVPRSERTQVFEWRYYMSTPPTRQAGRADLVIARQILRAHGGDIVVGCSPQGGARFSAQLPLLGEHEVELAQAS
jgi:signal transduction histidine kinase